MQNSGTKIDSTYLYAASGDRAWKLTGPEMQMQLNAKTVYTNVDFEKTLYTSPLMVMTETEYTKHYFIDGERICSKIGGGFGLLPDLQRPTVSQVSFIQGTAETVKANLQTMLNRTISCVNYTGLWTIEEALAPAYNINNVTENSRYFYHSDHLGSASMITDRSGRAHQHIQYLPFGELFVSQRNSTFDSRYKFTAKELDNETNYTYFGARYYDSDLSSWLSVDPMASERSWVSPYSYCQNSPVMRVDPTGALDGEVLDKWKYNQNTRKMTWEGEDGGENTQFITTVEYNGSETYYEIDGAGFDITRGAGGVLYKENEYGLYRGGHTYWNLLGHTKPTISNDFVLVGYGTYVNGSASCAAGGSVSMGEYYIYSQPDYVFTFVEGSFYTGIDLGASAGAFLIYGPPDLKGDQLSGPGMSVGVGYLFGEVSVQTSATESYIPTYKYYIVGVGGSVSINGGGVKLTNTYVQQSKN